MRELVGDDDEPRLEQIGRRARLHQPEDEVLRDGGRPVLRSDARAPLADDSRAHFGQGTFTSSWCGGGGLHIIPGGQLPPPENTVYWAVHVWVPGICDTCSGYAVSGTPVGQSYGPGGGGLHISPGAHDIEIIAVHLPLVLLTDHTADATATDAVGATDGDAVAVGAGGLASMVGGADAVVVSVGAGGLGWGPFSLLQAAGSAATVTMNDRAKMRRGACAGMRASVPLGRYGRS
jgi:hypothetical protein